jgi:hypothetical protein
MPVLLQETLARKALRELGVDLRTFEIDHLEGITTVNGFNFDVLYPLSWVRRSLRLKQPKRYQYCFMGIMDSDRRDALAAFVSRGDSVVEHTRHQRNVLLKGRFGRRYWKVLNQSFFALCPQRADWPGSAKRAWTYRFVEATLAFSIPVVFDSLPLGDAFTEGFVVANAVDTAGVVWTPEIAEHNFHHAVRRFVLPHGLLSASLQQPNSEMRFT